MLLLDENNFADFIADCGDETISGINPGDILIDGSAAWLPTVRVIAVTEFGILVRRPRGALVTVAPAKLFATKPLRRPQSGCGRLSGKRKP